MAECLCGGLHNLMLRYWPCPTSKSIWRSFVTISSGLCCFAANFDPPVPIINGGPTQWGRTSKVGSITKPHRVSDGVPFGRSSDSTCLFVYLITQLPSYKMRPSLR